MGYGMAEEKNEVNESMVGSDSLSEQEKQVSGSTDSKFSGKSYDELNEKKEASFERLKEIEAKITEDISLVQEKKQKRNEFTQKVKELKVDRDKKRDEINALIEKAKVLNEEKKEILKKTKGDHVNPDELKRRIEQIESKIETEVLAFKKEQELMKELNKLKKEYSSMSSGSKVLSEAYKLSKEIDSLKAVGKSLHDSIQDFAQKSQEEHNLMLKFSQEIDELKDEKKKLYDEITKIKAELGIKKTDGKKSFEKKKAASDKAKKEKADVKKKKMEKTLETKQKEVEEKLRNGDKLTTEDLIILQNLSTDEF